MYETINEALKKYNAYLTSENIIGHNRMGETNIKVIIKKNRMRCESKLDGTLIFSGKTCATSIENFVESFWFWEKSS